MIAFVFVWALFAGLRLRILGDHCFLCLKEAVAKTHVLYGTKYWWTVCSL